MTRCSRTQKCPESFVLFCFEVTGEIKGLARGFHSGVKKRMRSSKESERKREDKINFFWAFILCVQPISWTSHTPKTVTSCPESPFSPHNGLAASLIWMHSPCLISCFALHGPLTPAHELLQFVLTGHALLSPQACCTCCSCVLPPDSFPQFLLICYKR